MEEAGILVHESVLEIGEESFSISIYARNDGLHFAKTKLSAHDIIINDGHSLEHALKKHRDLLPLAIASRKFRAEQRDCH